MEYKGRVLKTVQSSYHPNLSNLKSSYFQRDTTRYDTRNKAKIENKSKFKTIQYSMVKVLLSYIQVISSLFPTFDPVTYMGLCHNPTILQNQNRIVVKPPHNHQKLLLKHYELNIVQVHPHKPLGPLTPVTRTFSDLYHIKFAPEDDVHGLKAENLCFQLQNQHFLTNVRNSQVPNEVTLVQIL